MAKRKTTITPEMILVDSAPEIRVLAERLRTLIRETVPEAVETAYPGWRAIGYRHPERGYFGAIFPETGRVRLAFEWGVLLPDPHGLLSGAGKQVRYVDIYEAEELRETAISNLLLAAASLPADRSIKLALIRQSAKPSTVSFQSELLWAREGLQLNPLYLLPNLGAYSFRGLLLTTGLQLLRQTR